MFSHGLRKDLVLPALERRFSIHRSQIVFIDDRVDNLQDLLTAGLGLAIHAPSYPGLDDRQSLMTFDLADAFSAIRSWAPGRFTRRNDNTSTSGTANGALATDGTVHDLRKTPRVQYRASDRSDYATWLIQTVGVNTSFTWSDTRRTFFRARLCLVREARGSLLRSARWRSSRLVDLASAHDCEQELILRKSKPTALPSPVTVQLRPSLSRRLITHTSSLRRSRVC